LCIPAAGCRDTQVSHAPELLFSTLTLYFLVQNQLGWSVFFATATTLTRINDFPILLMVLVHWLDAHAQRSGGWRRFLKERSAYWIVLAAALCIPFLRIILSSGYQGAYRFQDVVADIRWNHLLPALVGYQAGLLWSEPWWLFCFAIGLWHVRALSNTSRVVLFWMALHLVIAAAWGGPAGPYYRYFVGTTLGAMFLHAELWNRLPSRVQTISRCLLVYQATILTYLTFVRFTPFSPVWEVLPEQGLLKAVSSAFRSVLLIGTGALGTTATHLFPVLNTFRSTDTVFSGARYWGVVLPTIFATATFLYSSWQFFKLGRHSSKNQRHKRTSKRSLFAAHS
jgi:hypothetical protein